MNTLLNVRSDQVEGLINSPQRSVDLVRDLLWAESGRQGLNPLNISVSEKIYAKDGGVDGTTINMEPAKEGLLFKGVTYYQIKSGEAFNPNKEECLRTELLKNDSLKTGLRALARSKGTYVLVWFGGSFKGNQELICTDQIKNIFSEKGVDEVSVFILDRCKLAQCCSQHPVIQSTYFNDLSQWFLTLEAWKDRFPTKKPKPSNAQEKTTPELNNEAKLLRKSSLKFPYESVQILCKEMNRQDYASTVYEALKIDGCRQKVICIDGDDLRVPLSTTLETRSDLNQIVVVDNCKKEHHQRILDTLGQRSTRLGMVILSVDSNPISDDRFRLIGDPQPVTSSLLGGQISNDPTDQVKSVQVIPSSKVPGQKLLRLTRKVNETYQLIAEEEGYYVLNAARRFLRFLALFSKVGSETNVTPEFSFLAKTLGYSQPEERLELAEIVNTLRKHKLIDGENYLTVADQKHRLFLIQEWWTIYSPLVDFRSLLSEIHSLSENMAQRLLDSLPYITATSSGKRLVKTMLGEPGIFSTGHLLREEFGSQLFGKLAEADPEAALSCLQRTIGTWSKEELLSFTTGRREVIWALEKIVIWRKLFTDGAYLLLALAEAENEDWGNNASGVFAGLFTPGHGSVAPTEASPQERFPVLREALEAESKERRQLALRACDTALETMHFVRMVGAENQGLQKEPQLWTPKTYGELFSAYREVWELLESKLDNLTPDEKTQAVDILLHRIRELIRFHNLADMVFKTTSNLTTKTYVDKKQVLSEIINLLYFDKEDMPPKIRTQWETLRDKLIGNDFHSLMERYVGMALLQDQYDETGVQPEETKQQIKKLAKDALMNKELIEPELSWLVTEEAKNGYAFGYELGTQDEKFILLNPILEAQKEVRMRVSLFFLGGYFKALHEDSPILWDEQIDTLSKNKLTAKWIPELTWRTGVTDKSASRLLNLAKKGIVEVNSLYIFGYGGVIHNLSEQIFTRWINFLIDSKEVQGALIALNLYHLYYIVRDSDKTMPRELTMKVLLNPLLLQPIPRDMRDQMAEHNWTEIGNEYVKLYPENSLKIGKKVLQYFNEDETIFDGLYSRTQEVLNNVTKLYPEEIWKEAAKYLGPPIDTRAYQMKTWLRGGKFFSEKKGALPIIPPERVWDWVEKDIDNRAWYLATFVPKALFRNKKHMCWSRQVLVRYGDREDVRRNLMSNFSSEGWTGPMSSHYKQKKEELLRFVEKETNKNVKQWVKEYVESLDNQIDRARIEEERDGF